MPPPLERIARFIESPDPEEFEPLAQAVAAAAGHTGGWRTLPPAESSGDEPPRTNLGSLAAASVFSPVTALAGPRPAVLDLMSRGAAAVPATRDLADLSSHGDIREALSARGVEVARARNWLAARQRGGERCLVVTGERGGLEDLLKVFERRHLRFRLPSGSAVVRAVDAGSTPPREFCVAVEQGLGVAESAVFGVYRPRGGVTPFLARGADGWLEPAPWTRVWTGSAERGEGADTDQGARLAVFDLAAAEGTVCLLSDDWAVVGERGFRVVPPPAP